VVPAYSTAVALTVVVPTATARTSPSGLTAVTVGSLEANSTTAFSSTLPSASTTWASSWTESLRNRVGSVVIWTSSSPDRSVG
jgi:hypothetical protein